jgi:hypothetical protein
MMKAGEMYQVMIDDSALVVMGTVAQDEDEHGYFVGWEMTVGGANSTAGKFYGLSYATRRVREVGRQQIVRLVPEPLTVAAPMLRHAPTFDATPLELVDRVIGAMR